MTKNIIELSVQDRLNLIKIEDFLREKHDSRCTTNSGRISFALEFTERLMIYDKDKPIEEQLMNKQNV